MAWIPKPSSMHYGRTNADYSHLLALRQKYPNKPAPIEELKAACLADGYPPEKVAKMSYPDLSTVDVVTLLKPKKKKPEYIRKREELEYALKEAQEIQSDDENDESDHEDDAISVQCSDCEDIAEEYGEFEEDDGFVSE